MKRERTRPLACRSSIVVRSEIATARAPRYRVRQAWKCKAKTHLKGNGVRGAPRASTRFDPGEQESKAQDELRWLLDRRKMHTIASRTGTGTRRNERGRREHDQDDELAPTRRTGRA